MALAGDRSRQRRLAETYDAKNALERERHEQSALEISQRDRD
jgi:hypothetical protein